MAGRTGTEAAPGAALVRDVYIEARPETVFPFLVEPAKMTRWMGIAAVFEPRPGGLYRVEVDGENVARGAVIEVSPPRRVVYSFGWEGGEALPPGASTVTITLAAEGTGTRLTLRHEGLPADLTDAHGDGWDHYAGRLAVAAAGGDAGPDPWIKTAAAR